MDKTDQNALSDDIILNTDAQSDQELFPNERHPILTNDEKYFFEKKIFLSMLLGKKLINCLQPPSSQELDILSYNITKLFQQNNINPAGSNSSNSNSDSINSGTMSRILCFLSKYLNNRSPLDTARIWKLVLGNEESMPNEFDFDSTKTPETSSVAKYRKNSTVSINKRKIAVNRKKEILLGSLDSENKEIVNIPETSLIIPYIDSFAAMTHDGKIYCIKENSDEKYEYELLLNAQKPLSDFRISQTITPIIAGLSNDSQNIIYGQGSSYKEYKFTDKITQLQINSSKLTFSTMSSFYVLDDDRIIASYEYSKNLNDFRILQNDMIILAYGETFYELFDMRMPDKIFNSSFETNHDILDCQISPLNNLFAFSQQKLCSIYDIRNPTCEIMSFNPTEDRNSPYKVKWIGDDRLLAVAGDTGFYNLANISSESVQILKTYTLTPGKILDLSTTDDTVIITQPNTVSVFQMNTRPILLPNFT